MSCSYVVARYKEAGNMGGEYKKNVFKGSFTSGLCDKLNDLIKDIPSDNSDSIKKINDDSDNEESGINVPPNIDGSDHLNVVDDKAGSYHPPLNEHKVQAYNITESGISYISDNSNLTEGNSVDAFFAEQAGNITTGSSNSSSDNLNVTEGNGNSVTSEQASSIENIKESHGDNSNFAEEEGISIDAHFDENGLQAHNKFRAIHGSTNLKIDPTLSKDAELYAKELAKIGHLKHAILEDIGENLAYGCSSKVGYELSAAEATYRW